MGKAKLIDYVDKYSIIACFLLPFVVPSKNIYLDFILRTYIVIILGIFSWFRILQKKKISQLEIAYKIPLAVIILMLILDLFLYHDSYAMFGGIYMQIGIVSLLSIIGICINSINKKIYLLFQGLFLSCIALSIFSFYFQSTIYGSLFSNRLIGPFFQSDILAIYLSLGFLAGLIFIGSLKSIKSKFLFSIGESIIMTGIIFTQTRLVIILLLLISCIYLIYTLPKKIRLVSIIFMTLTASLIIFVSIILRPNYNLSSLYDSTIYRFELQSAAISHSNSSIFIGKSVYGLSSDLECKNLNKFYELRKTCNNYIFQSSHNLFLDHSIMFGYIAGIMMFFAGAYSIYICFKNPNNNTVLLGLILTTTTIYYFSNVNSIELELLYWLLIGGVISSKPKIKNPLTKNN